MIRSMTAFARCQNAERFGTLIWEVRSVNHRYLDVNMRLPDELRGMEGRFRELINTGLRRGKLECCLRFKAEVAIEAGVEVNQVFARSMIHACEQVNAMLHQSSAINVVDILKWPGVVKETALDMKPVAAASEVLLQQALEELVSNRKREGERLKDLIVQRCDDIDGIIVQVRGQLMIQVELLRMLMVL